MKFDALTNHGHSPQPRGLCSKLLASKPYL